MKSNIKKISFIILFYLFFTSLLFVCVYNLLKDISASLTVFGLGLDIIGGFYVLRTFFSLSKAQNRDPDKVSFKTHFDLTGKKINSTFLTLHQGERNFNTEMINDINKTKIKISQNQKKVMAEEFLRLQNKNQEEIENLSTDEKIQEHSVKWFQNDYIINLKKQNKKIDDTIEEFYRNMGIDSITGFVFLFTGFSFQIIGQIL